MNIAILLPYKENFAKKSAGAVSLFVNDTTKLSKYKNKINIFGSTEHKDVLNNYKNIKFEKKFYQSASNEYLKKFFNQIKKKKIDVLEIHNRPHYVDYLNNKLECKKILYFHNDPIKMQGSNTVKERLKLLKLVDKIVFNSYWSKSRYLIDLPENINADKLKVIHQSTSKAKINFNKKKKII